MTDVRWKMELGDSLDVMRRMDDNSVDSVVCDPPYSLKFMGKAWDYGIPRPEYWAEALRVAKPGAHLVAFGGSRTYHRLACAIEDAGWEIRNSLMWLYASGMPKGLNVSRAVDKHLGKQPRVMSEHFTGFKGTMGGVAALDGLGDKPDVRRATEAATQEGAQWEGWNTELKPAYEAIVLARKPIVGTVANNVLTYGVGGLNIDATRIPFVSDTDRASAFPGGRTTSLGSGSLAGPADAQEALRSDFATARNDIGRYPANLLLDCACEGTAHDEGCPVRVLDEQSGTNTGARSKVHGHEDSQTGQNGIYGTFARVEGPFYGDTGGASRFFYCSKAGRKEKNAGLASPCTHTTVKPLALMKWLTTLVTPPNGLILDPFAGSGSTGCAAVQGGFRFIGIEKEEEYAGIAQARIAHWAQQTIKGD